MSVASRANKPIGDKMIMNAAFLVDRASESGFDARVKEIGGQVRHADLPLHRPLAALQLREHPAEAGAGEVGGGRAGTAVIVLDTLLIGGIKFVLRRIVEAVDAELNDVDTLREELLAAQMRVELGEMSDEQFAEIEGELLARIREIQRAGP